MKNRDAPRHPGPWRTMRVDSELTGVLVAVGFLVMGLVSMPIAAGFVVGALVFGGVIALLLRLTPTRFTRWVLGTVTGFVALALLWTALPPRRPHGVSPRALHIEPTNVPFTLQRVSYWLDCWFDEQAKVDRCRLTDVKGAELYEDVFLPCVGQLPLPQSELALDPRRTGQTWTRSHHKGINIPVVYLTNRRVLLAQSIYAEAKQDARCSPF